MVFKFYIFVHSKYLTKTQNTRKNTQKQEFIFEILILIYNQYKTTLKCRFLADGHYPKQFKK